MLPVLSLFTCLLLALSPLSIEADVYVLTKTYVLEPLSSLQADFGPPLPAEGLDGVLRAADPLDACSPFNFTDLRTPWVALISREQHHKSLDCTFDVKVRHAEQAGARAAIVFDDLYESLIIMSKPQDHPDPGIPSVFVSEKAGALLVKLLQLDQVHVRITPVSAVAWISMVMSAFLGLLAMTIVFTSFYVMRTWSYWLAHGHHPQQQGQDGATGRQGPQNQGLPSEVLRSFPVIVHESKGSLPSSPRRAAEQSSSHTEKGNSCNSSECEVPLPPGVHAGETKRMCTICLEQYEEGDKVRILPCYHRFHMQCIDAWLSGRSACPVCKHDASQPLQSVLDIQPDHEQQQQEGGGTLGTDVEGGRQTHRRWWSSWLGLSRRSRGSGFLGWFRGRSTELLQQHEQSPLLSAQPNNGQQQQQQASNSSSSGQDIEAGARPAPTVIPAAAASTAATAVGSAGQLGTQQQQQQQQQALEQQVLRLQQVREQQELALRQWQELQAQIPQARQRVCSSSPPAPAVEVAAALAESTTDTTEPTAGTSGPADVAST